jgi:peptide-methionine (S)-S-oxide reductase
MQFHKRPVSLSGQLSRRHVLLGGACALFVAPWLIKASWANEEPFIISPPSSQYEEAAGLSRVVLAGGCFWGVQGVFQRVKGVKNAVSGYSGGAADTARYDLVTSGTTGHAEAVEVTYNPAEVNLADLLQVFFSVAHNPTQLDFQGPDHGTQYRTAVFTSDPVLAAYVLTYIAELDASGEFGAPIVTTLEPLAAFYPAEQYHQDFLTLNPSWPYIVFYDLPKIAALERVFPSLFRADPVLVGQL